MAELKIFKPEVKKPDGATEKIALSGTVLPFEHRTDFPANGVSDVFYFSQYENLLYQWDSNILDYKPLSADSIYYRNLVGDNTEGKISIKLTSNEFGLPILSPVFSRYSEGSGEWTDKKILLEGDVSVDLSGLVKYNKGTFEQQSYIELLYDDESKPSYLMSPAAGIVTESSDSLAVLGSYALPFYRINGRGINALESLNTPKLCIYNKGVIEYSKSGASSTSKYVYNLPEKNGTIALTKDLDNYLLKTAKAADSDKLDGHDGSYYLNYNNLTNVPTIDLQGFAKYGKDTSINGIKLLYDDGSAPSYLITSNYGLIPGSAGSSSIGTKYYQFGAIHGEDYNVYNSLKISKDKKIYHDTYELSLPTKSGVIALVSDIANNISLIDDGTKPIIGDIEYDNGTFTVSRIGLEDLGLASAYKYKGSKATLSDIENLTNKSIGDVWNCEENGMNYAWDGEQWDALGSIVDLSDYATKEWVENKDYVTSGWIDSKNYATEEWVGNNFLSLKGGTIDGNLVITDTLDTKTLIVNKIEPGVSEDNKPNVSIRVGANLVINNGEVVIGDGGQVHARGQITTHANRILFASEYDDDLSKEEQFSYSLGLPFTAFKHTKNVAAFLPENGGHLATKEFLKDEFCYWSIKKFGYDNSGEWYVNLAVEGKNIDHINLLLCSQSEGWNCPLDAGFTVERDDNFVARIHFDGDDLHALIQKNMIGAYNFKELPKLGHIRNVSELSERTILRHPIYFKFVAVTKNNYKFDSTVMKVTQRSDRRYILDIQ